MYFISVKDKLPNDNQIVLIKEKELRSPYDNKILNPEKYYICVFHTLYSEFIEASGEEYHFWTANEVEGWMPVEELDNIPIITSSS